MTPTPKGGATVFRPLLILAFAFLMLGLYAACTGGLRTGAFWPYLIATNVCALLARRPRSILLWAPVAAGLSLFACGIFVHSPNGRDAFVEICRSRPTSAVRQALVLGSELDSCGRTERRTPLTAAVEFHRTSTIRLLLNAGADPNRSDAYGWTPLMVARYLKQSDIADLLRAYGAEERPLPVLPRSSTYSARRIPEAFLALP